MATSDQKTSTECRASISLTELYDLHERGELDSMDQRWNIVARLIHKIVVTEVTKSAKRLYGEPLEAAIVDVEGTVLHKFIGKRFTPRRTPTIEPLLRVTCRNDMLTMFRRSKSPSTVGFDGAEAAWTSDHKPITDERIDMFGRIRGNLETFRFHEHTHVREALLAVFLSQHKYPGPGFLSPLGVGATQRQDVYNAAVVDLNCAMMGICDGAYE